MSNPYGIDDRRRIEQFKGWLAVLGAVAAGVLIVLLKAVTGA
jgi:hypothetical protein